MDIFKLGDKILALLEVVFGFWNNQISLVFALLGQSPVSFKNGGPWAVIESIEPTFVGVGSSLVVLFFVIGFCSESIDVKDAYNVQPGITINYKNGDSKLSSGANAGSGSSSGSDAKKDANTGKDTDSTAAKQTYILNTNSRKFHRLDCSSASQISDANREEYTGTREELIEQGYTPCGYCKP